MSFLAGWKRGAGNIGTVPAIERTVLAAALLWCLAIVAAPLFEIGFLYRLFSTICHQLPDRSWFLQGHPLAVCIRCSAIYLGFLTALVVRLPSSTRLLRIALAVTALEFIGARLIADVEAIRALSGLLLGLATAGFVQQGIGEAVSRLYRPHRRTLPEGAS